MKTINCTTCGRDGHYQTFCPNKPRKPIETKTVPKRSKPVKRTGTRLPGRWRLIRDRVLLTYPDGTPCHYCGIKLNTETITLDHRIPRSRAPELRYEPTNLVPCCFTCNGLKGSVDHDTYQHNCPDNVKETV